ncbi:MAG: hypothetical protein ACJ8AJ_07340, partial [Gemmatimonadaceae bacterium]
MAGTIGMICFVSAVSACSAGVSERRAESAATDTMMVGVTNANSSIDSCQMWIREQATYLRNERLADTLTLDRFPAKGISPEKLARLDPSSSRSARAFRTRVRAAL